MPNSFKVLETSRQRVLEPMTNTKFDFRCLSFGIFFTLVTEAYKIDSPFIPYVDSHALGVVYSVYDLK